VLVGVGLGMATVFVLNGIGGEVVGAGGGMLAVVVVDGGIAGGAVDVGLGGLRRRRCSVAFVYAV
jgi:hypothetical protein